MDYINEDVFSSIINTLLHTLYRWWLLLFPLLLLWFFLIRIKQVISFLKYYSTLKDKKLIFQHPFFMILYFKIKTLVWWVLLISFAWDLAWWVIDFFSVLISEVEETRIITSFSKQQIEFGTNINNLSRYSWIILVSLFIFAWYMFMFSIFSKIFDFCGRMFIFLAALLIFILFIFSIYSAFVVT